MTYEPKPINTSEVIFPEELNDLIEIFARNNHDHWAKQRIDEGWVYGKERNDKKKEHPSLVPYEKLNELEKNYDRKTAKEAIKLVIKLGYELKK